MTFLGEYPQVYNIPFQYIVLSLFYFKKIFLNYSFHYLFCSSDFFSLVTIIYNKSLSSTFVTYSQIPLLFFISFSSFISLKSLSCLFVFVFLWLRLRYINDLLIPFNFFPQFYHLFLSFSKSGFPCV